MQAPRETDQVPLEELAALAERLDRVAGPVRELSHRLWQQEAAIPVASDRQLLKYAMTGSVVRPRWSLAFFTVLGIVALGRTYGWSQAIVISGTYAATVLVAARVINAFAASGRHSVRRLLAVSTTAALLVPVPFAVAMLAFGLPVASVAADWAAALMYTVLVIPLASSVLSPITRRRIAVEAMLQQVTQDDVRTLALAHEHASMCRELARHMHGTVQADLYAASLRLSAGLDPSAAGSWGSVRNGEDLASLLLMKFPAEPDGGERHLAPHLDRLAAQWQGIVDIRIELQPDAAQALLGAAVCTNVVAMLTEVVHDALHHGSAATVAVGVSVDEEAVWVTAEDDGTPVDGASTPGLGSTLLGQGTVQWLRTPRADGQGTLVRFAVSREADEGSAGPSATGEGAYANPSSANS